MSKNMQSGSRIVLSEGNATPYYEQRDVSCGLQRNGSRGPQSRCLHFKFLDNIHGPVYTGLPIRGERGPLKVALIDADSGDVVKSRPEASAKLEIVVLHKNFNFTDDEDWTSEDFSSKILVTKEGKSLLKGDPNPYVHLVEGVGFLNGVLFKHTKKWFNKSEYTLGARIVDQSNGKRIREAKTKPFFVKDQRMINKEHKPLVLKDDVRQLKGIGKKGRLRDLLRREKITTVEQFLIAFHLNCEKLRKIFEASKSDKTWGDTTKHALTCKLEETRHLVGLCQQGWYVPVEEISASDKDLGHKLVVPACEHNSLVYYLSSSKSPIIPSEPVKVDGSNGWNSPTSVVNENPGTVFSTSSQVAISQSHYMTNASTLNDYSLHTHGSSYHIFSRSWCYPSNFPPSPGNVYEYQGYQNWNTEDDQNNDRYDPGPNAATNLQSCLVASSGKARKWWKKVSPVFKLLFHKKKKFSSEHDPMAKRRKFC